MKEKVWLREWNLIKWLCLALMTLALLLPAKTAKADNFTLTLNDVWVNGNVPTKTTNFYEFVVPAAGWINITYQGWNIKDSYICIKNADLTKQYWDKRLYSTSDSNPGTESFGSWMEAGTYTVCVKGRYDDSQGDYRLKGNYSPANNTEKEPNNGFQTAMPLVSEDAGKVLGLISTDDRVDFYSIYIPTTQKVQIIFNCMIWDGRFEIWDKDFVQKHSKTVNSCTEENPKTYTYEETLTAGIWYIKIEPRYSSSQGRYYLSWKQKQEIVLASAISISGGRNMNVGEQINLYVNVLPSNVTNDAVNWSSDNTSVATVDRNGKVTAKNAGTAYIKATAADGSGVSTTCKITVKAANGGSQNEGAKKVTSIKIIGNKRVAAGSSFQLSAIVSPTNAANKAVKWSSSIGTVAAVSSSGKVTTKKPGKTVITASATDGSGKKASITVIVVPKKVKISSKVSTTKKQLQLSWKKQKGISGYQIQWSKNKNFKNAKKGFVVKNAKGAKIKNLTSKKKYYVRVRSYVKIGSKKYYGAWSAVKYKKVK